MVETEACCEKRCEPFDPCVKTKAEHCNKCMDPRFEYFGEDACVCKETDDPRAYHVGFTYMGETFSVNVNIGCLPGTEECRQAKAIMMATMKIMQSPHAEKLGPTGWVWLPSACRANFAKITRICWRNVRDNGGMIYFPEMSGGY